jgi:hypothetical protein
MVSKLNKKKKKRGRRGSGYNRLRKESDADTLTNTDNESNELLEMKKDGRLVIDPFKSVENIEKG